MERLEPGRRLELIRRLHDPRHEIGVRRDEVADLHLLRTMDEDPQRAVGHLEHAGDDTGHADAVEVGRAGLLLLDPGRRPSRLRLPPRTSFTSWIERCCPDASGVSVSGNGTLSRSGRIGRASERQDLGAGGLGLRQRGCGCSLAAAARPMRADPLLDRHAADALVRFRQRNLDLQHAVLVARARLLGEHLGAGSTSRRKGPCSISICW